MTTKLLLSATLLSTTVLTTQAQNNWQIGGNAPPSGSFVGTTNTQPLIFKVNNNEVARFKNPTNNYLFDIANGINVGANATINGLTATNTLNISKYNGNGMRLLQIDNLGNVLPFTMGNANQYLDGTGNWKTVTPNTKLLSTDANGNIIPFILGATNQYLRGDGVWTNFPASPTQYFTAGSTANSVTTNYDLGIALTPTQQNGIVLNTQASTQTNATAVQTITKDNQYVLRNTATYLDDNGTPVTAQNFSVTSLGAVDATEYKLSGAPLAKWRQLSNPLNVTETFISNAFLGTPAQGTGYPISIGTTNSPAQSLRTFVSQNANISVPSNAYRTAQLLNMEGEDPTLIFRDNVVAGTSNEKADLLIGAANGAARFVTNNGFAFFMNADNNAPANSFNGFKILKDNPFFTLTNKEVLALQPDGEFTIRGNNIFGSGTDNRLLQLSNTGVLFTRTIDASSYLLNGQQLGLWSTTATNDLYYTGGSVGIGTNAPHCALDIEAPLLAGTALGETKNGLCINTKTADYGYTLALNTENHLTKAISVVNKLSNKESFLLYANGGLTIRGNAPFGTTNDDRLLELNTNGQLFTREVNASNYLLNGQPLPLSQWQQATSPTGYNYIKTINITPIAFGNTTNSPSKVLRDVIAENSIYSSLADNALDGSLVSSYEGQNPTLVLRDNVLPSGVLGHADLAIGATDEWARFVTNYGFAFFMNADNKKTSGSSNFDDFRIMAQGSNFNSQKNLFNLTQKGELTLTADDDNTVAFAINKQNVLAHNFAIKGNGFVYAREVNVYTTNMVIPDYVFDKTYKLRTLAEVENYITTNKHLPNIPSAKEIQDKGTLSLTEMNLKLLEKVEELTLYMIEQNKKVEAQGKELQELKKRLN
jgi:hypothetical protein